MRTELLLLVGALAYLNACSPSTKQAKTSHDEAPASVQNKVAESELTRVTLSEKAEERLGIATSAVSSTSTQGQSFILGDIVPIPGRSILVGAPVSGTVSAFQSAIRPGLEIRAGQLLFHLTPQVAAQRDLRLTLQADMESTKARLENATQQALRARQLLRDLAGSQRNVDVAEQELGQAKAAHDAALARMKRLESAPLDADVDVQILAPAAGILRQLQVAPGQLVNAGTMLLELADFSKVWLRVPVYAGQLKDIEGVAQIRVRDADGEGRELQARQVSAPPTADPLSATSDLYYELDNPQNALRPGQRMTAILPTRGVVNKAISLPKSAILYDVHGDAWVYVAEGKRRYRRQRVEVLGSAGSNALISRGLSDSMMIVTVGAAELFGTEFGAGH